MNDVADRMEDRLRDRGITDPAAWLARPGRDLDATLAEAVTLSVDDILLTGLLDRLSATALATELIIGASVYRIPVDDTALTFQVGQPAERAPDPERADRIGRVQQALQETIQRSEDGKISLEDTGLSEQEYARYQADVAEEIRPPVEAPEGLAAAVTAARNAGLLVPVPAQDGDPRHFVHRWTAGAIAALHPDATRQAHQQAAAFWRWRVRTIPQSREQDIEQLLEARYHHHAAGQDGEALAAHAEAVTQLQTWGQYGRAAELCRETLTWLAPDSQEAGVTEGTFGNLAQLRGDYDSAERSHREVLEIFTRLGDQKNMATSYRNASSAPAEDRGDYDIAEPQYRRALDILERTGDQACAARSYHQLGTLAQDRGDYDAAETLYPVSLDIKERIGDQAGAAAATASSAPWPICAGITRPPSPCTAVTWTLSSGSATRPARPAATHQLGVVAEDRAEIPTAAEPLYRRNLAQLRGDYDAAEPVYRRSLDIRTDGDQARHRHQLSAWAA